MGKLCKAWNDIPPKGSLDDELRATHHFLLQWERKYPLCDKTREQVEGALDGAFAASPRETLGFWKALGQEPRSWVLLNEGDKKRVEELEGAVRGRDEQVKAIAEERDEARAEVVAITKSHEFLAAVMARYENDWGLEGCWASGLSFLHAAVAHLAAECKRLEAEVERLTLAYDAECDAVGTEAARAALLQAEVERLKGREVTTDPDFSRVAPVPWTDADVEAIAGWAMDEMCRVGCSVRNRDRGYKAALAEARKRRPTFEVGQSVRLMAAGHDIGTVVDPAPRLCIKVAEDGDGWTWWSLDRVEPLPPEPEFEVGQKVILTGDSVLSGIPCVVRRLEAGGAWISPPLADGVHGFRWFPIADLKPFSPEPEEEEIEPVCLHGMDRSCGYKFCPRCGVTLNEGG